MQPDSSPNSDSAHAQTAEASDSSGALSAADAVGDSQGESTKSAATEPAVARPSRLLFGREALGEFRAQSPLAKLATVSSVLGAVAVVIGALSWIYGAMYPSLDAEERAQIERQLRAEYPGLLDEQIRAALDAIANTRSSGVLQAAQAADFKAGELELRRRRVQMKEKPSRSTDLAKIDRDLAALVALTDPTEAYKLYAEATQLDPKNLKGWFGRGVTAMAMSQFEPAVESLDTLEQLAAQQGNAPAQATARMLRGTLHDGQGKRDLALADYRNALDLASQSPQVTGAARAYLVSAIEMDLASMHAREGRKGDALQHISRAETVLAERLREAPSDEYAVSFRITLGVCYVKHSSLLSESERAQSDEFLKKALLAFDEAAGPGVRALPEAIEARAILAFNAWERGERSKVANQLHSALDDAKALEQAATSALGREGRSQVVARVHAFLAVVYAGLKSLDAAESHATQAVRRFVPLAATSRSLLTEQEAAGAQVLLGRVLFDKGKLQEGESYLTAAAAILESHRIRYAPTSSVLGLLSTAYWSLSEVRQRVGDLRGAVAYAGNAVIIDDERAVLESYEYRAVGTALSAHAKLGRLLALAGLPQEAAAEFNHVIAASATLRQRDVRFQELATLQLLALLALGDLQFRTQNAGASARTLQGCIEEFAALAPDMRADAERRRQAAMCNSELGRALFVEGERDAALVPMGNAVAMWTQLARDSPEPINIAMRGETLVRFGALQHYTGKSAVGLETIAGAIDMLRAASRAHPSDTLLAITLEDAERASVELNAEVRGGTGTASLAPFDAARRSQEPIRVEWGSR